MLYIVAGLAGLLALALSLAPDWNHIWNGLNDFPAFYLAPRMLATGDLYHPLAFLAKQQQLLGRTNESIVYIRLPYLAVMLAPLSQLPYPVAYALWQALSLTALALFAGLWPARRAVSLRHLLLVSAGGQRTLPTHRM